MAGTRRYRGPAEDSIPHRPHHPAYDLKAASRADQNRGRSEHTALSTRIAALILLLYGIPVRKICELTRADVAVTPERTTIKIGNLPAPIPQALLPLFHQHLAAPGNHRTMNHDSTWLFPGTNAGQHITEQMLMKRLRSLGIDITAAKNGALHDLIKEIDPHRWQTCSATHPRP